MVVSCSPRVQVLMRPSVSAHLHELSPQQSGDWASQPSSLLQLQMGQLPVMQHEGELASKPLTLQLQVPSVAVV